MYALRRSFMDLKPEVPPEKDRAFFDRWLSDPDTLVTVARDSAGEIQVFTDLCSRSVLFGGERYLIFYGEYIFAAARWRGHPAYAYGGIQMLLRLLGRARQVRRVVCLGASYPASFVSVTRAFPTTFLAGEPDVPPSVADLVDALAPAVLGDRWDPQTRHVRMSTLPTDTPHRSPASLAIRERYERRVPRWREGFTGLGVLFLTPAVLFQALQLVARRA